jgi:predicted transcriptional regulator
MTERRRTGALEGELMAYLWATNGPATPAEVHQAVAPDLAYTTVMTVLTRLWEKGLLSRETAGRAYAYEPVRTEAEHRADQMQTALESSPRRDEVLSSFVASLGADDAEVLRQLLIQEDS